MAAPNPHGQNGKVWLVVADPTLTLTPARASEFVQFAVSKHGVPTLSVFVLEPAQGNALAMAIGNALPDTHCRLVANHSSPGMRASNVRLLATSLWAIGYDVLPFYFTETKLSSAPDPWYMHWLDLRLPGERFVLP